MQIFGLGLLIGLLIGLFAVAVLFISGYTAGKS